MLALQMRGLQRVLPVLRELTPRSGTSPQTDQRSQVAGLFHRHEFKVGSVRTGELAEEHLPLQKAPPYIEVGFAQQLASVAADHHYKASRVHHAAAPCASRLQVNGSVRVCSFNLGGFCTASYDTFKVWLEDNGHRFDLLLLQETHFGLGKEPREYQLPGWTVISSPDSSHRWAGVAVLVSHRVAAASSLQYCIVVPGRLLHVRFPVGQGRQARHVDVACCYQWSWDADPAKQRLDKRLSYWRRLNTFVQGLPTRNVKCIGGDFNCALKAHPKHIGCTPLTSFTQTPVILRRP